MARLGSPISARARQMRRILAQWERSGLTLREFGRRRKIPPSTLRWWRHVFRYRNAPTAAVPVRRGTPQAHRRGAQGAAAFTELAIVPSPVSAPAVLEIVLRSGHVVRVPPGCATQRLGEVIGVLERAC
jgi:hypothetical protein